MSLQLRNGNIKMFATYDWLRCLLNNNTKHKPFDEQ